jgi:hypothetical protein
MKAVIIRKLEIMAITNNFSVDEFIEHVKVSGSLTEEGREYIDVRDVRLIIDTWLKQPKANNHEFHEL